MPSCINIYIYIIFSWAMYSIFEFSACLYTFKILQKGILLFLHLCTVKEVYQIFLFVLKIAGKLLAVANYKQFPILVYVYLYGRRQKSVELLQDKLSDAWHIHILCLNVTNEKRTLFLLVKVTCKLNNNKTVFFWNSACKRYFEGGRVGWNIR